MKSTDRVGRESNTPRGLEDRAFPTHPRGASGPPSQTARTRWAGSCPGADPVRTVPAVPQIFQEAFGLRSMLETNDEVVGVADDDHVAVRYPSAPRPVNPRSLWVSISRGRHQLLRVCGHLSPHRPRPLQPQHHPRDPHQHRLGGVGVQR